MIGAVLEYHLQLGDDSDADDVFSQILEAAQLSGIEDKVHVEKNHFYQDGKFVFFTTVTADSPVQLESHLQAFLARGPKPDKLIGMQDSVSLNRALPGKYGAQPECSLGARQPVWNIVHHKTAQ